MKRRASRTGREAHDQLSFFDPSGDLPNLREEARRISVAAEHQAFLEQGKRRAQAAIAELESEIELARRDAAQIAGSSGDHFQITLTDDGRAVVVTDRREAGEALRARMLAISADEDVVAFGQFAGLAMDASLIRDGEDVVWAPRLVGERSWFRSGTVNDGRHGKLSLHSNAVQIVTQFERILARITRELDALASGLAANRAELASFDHRMGVGSLRHWRQIADRHVFDHAPAQRADRLVRNTHTHGKLLSQGSCLRQHDPDRQEAFITAGTYRVAVQFNPKSSRGKVIPL